MNKIRILQVGVGLFGESWLDVVRNHPHAELAGVVDVMPDNLKTAREITGLPEERLFLDLDEALRQAAADMILLITPPPTHKELALKALEADLHVMMEKPLTHTYEEAVELLSATRKYDKKVMVSQNYRWNRPIQTLKKVLRDGTIGKVSYVEYAFRKAYKFGGWRDLYPEILLEDMSIHHFDILRYLLDKEPLEIFAQSFRPPWSWFKGKPSASVVMQFEDDVHVNYFGSWVTRGDQTAWNGDIRIVGEKGAVEMTNDSIRIQLGEDTMVEETIAVDLVDLPYDDRGMSLNDMIQAIQHNKNPLTSVEDNIHSFEITCIAVESAKIGEKIRVKDFSKVREH
jgi:predicted dehydrogenase